MVHRMFVSLQFFYHNKENGLKSLLRTGDLMEIYLEFAENKAIGAKRQGQQEESTLERIQTQTPRGCGERSPRSRAAVCKVLCF